MKSLRFAFFVLGLILLTISIVNYISLQVGVTHEAKSAPPGTPPLPTPTNASEDATVLPDIPVPSATPAPIASPQETSVVIAPTPVPSAPPAVTETPVPFTPVPPTPTPSVQSQPSQGYFGTPVVPLGTHIVQPREYLFCIGRAYGVLPQAIAEANFIALDTPLLDGQPLEIPDLPWQNIPPGRICRPQFESPYAPASVSMITGPPGLVPGSHTVRGGSPWEEDGSISGELQLINFVLPMGQVKRVGSQFVSLAVTPTPVLTEEIRRVRAESPVEMPLGASGVVTLTFNPDPMSQSEESDTTSSGQTNTTATNTPEPGEVIPHCEPLVISDHVFDNYDVEATARLDAAGFSYSPTEVDMQPVNKGEPVIWHWSIKPQDAGQQALIISLRLHYELKPNIGFDFDPPPRDGQICSATFLVDVRKSWFDLYTGYAIALLGIISTSLPILDRFRSKT